MNKLKNLIVLVLISISFVSHSDEGMWFLMHIKRLNQRDMQKMGLQLTAEEIYSINNSSLKDAIVQFNGGCTAELISKDGLLLTNHHCGYDAIAELSTPENDYLSNGWWAKTREDEMKPASLYVRFFVRMDDCSERIISKVNNDMSEEERSKIIRDEIALIQDENSEDGKYVVSVKSFFQGNEYYYFVYQDYTDVRLVGAPPSSIGKFGGDTDNWEWPRHTGDFSMFRVYANSQGEPAEYSKSNVPFTPKHHLPVNIKGIKDGEFAMILGYPGRTNRWLPSGGIDQNVKFAYPAWVEASKTAMDALKKHMDKDDKIRLDYASKYARIANYWKNRQGMIDALTSFKTAQTKAKNESKFNKWANKSENKALYGNVVENLNAYYSATNEKARHDNYLGILLRGSEFSLISRRLGRQLSVYASSDFETQQATKESMIEMVEEFYASLNIAVEKDVLTAGLNLYVNKADYDLIPSIDAYAVKYNNDMSTVVNSLFSTSILTSKDRLLAFIEYPSSGQLENDPIMVFSNEMLNHYLTKSVEIEELEQNFEKSYRLLVDGMRKSKISTIKYPDANSTLRLTYGKVSALPEYKKSDKKQNDAKKNYYTTLKGTIAKYKAGDEEFDLPIRLKELYENKDFGQYADKNGYMPVNFLTNNDITGGNSGSPVLNGKGELIGLAFDGNIEAMAGDVIFDTKLQKTINVDIRYVLFIIDKYAGAKHIVDEMTLIK